MELTEKHFNMSENKRIFEAWHICDSSLEWHGNWPKLMQLGKKIILVPSSIAIRPKTHTFECVLVQVGSWVLHVFVHHHMIAMGNSNKLIGMNIKHITFYLRTSR